MVEKIVTCYEGCPYYSNWEDLLDLCSFLVGENAVEGFDHPLANLGRVCLRGITEEAMGKHLKIGLEKRVGEADSEK